MLPYSRWSAHELAPIYPESLLKNLPAGMKPSDSCQAISFLGDASRQNGYIHFHTLFIDPREHVVHAFKTGEKVIFFPVDNSCLVVATNGLVYPAPFKLRDAKIPNVSEFLRAISPWLPEWTLDHKKPSDATHPSFLSPRFCAFTSYIAPSDAAIYEDVLMALLYFHGVQHPVRAALQHQVVLANGHLSAPEITLQVSAHSDYNSRDLDRFSNITTDINAQLASLWQNHYPLPAIPGQILNNGKVQAVRTDVFVTAEEVASAHQKMTMETHSVVQELRDFFSRLTFS